MYTVRTYCTEQVLIAFAPHRFQNGGNLRLPRRFLRLCRCFDPALLGLPRLRRLHPAARLPYELLVFGGKRVLIGAILAGLVEVKKPHAVVVEVFHPAVRQPRKRELLSHEEERQFALRVDSDGTRPV